MTTPKTKKGQKKDSVQDKPTAMALWSDVMTENARFLSDRLQRDLEMQKALLSCKSPADLLHIQSEFCQVAIEQYTAEAKRLQEMITEASKASFEEATPSLSRKYDDVPV